MKIEMFKKIFIITLILILNFTGANLSVYADSSGPIMTREQFDKWSDLPEYTIFNPFPNKGANCTWYAHGRMMQLGYSKYTLDSMRFNAKTWLDDADRGAEITIEPGVGAIAYWDGDAAFGSALGHVGVVEVVYDDGSIIVTDSSSSSGPFNIHTIGPDDRKWPTAFIIVPPEKDRSERFQPGQIIRSTVPNLNFRLTGVGVEPVLLSEGTKGEIIDHPSNGIYASRPRSTTSYHFWWYAAIEIDDELRHGWLAETHLELTEPADSSLKQEEDEAQEQETGVFSDDNDEEEITQFLIGDVTGTGAIDVRDVTMIMRYALSREEFDEDQLTRADINGDGIINIEDVVILMQYVLGLLDCLEEESMS